MIEVIVGTTLGVGVVGYLAYETIKNVNKPNGRILKFQDGIPTEEINLELIPNSIADQIDIVKLACNVHEGRTVLTDDDYMKLLMEIGYRDLFHLLDSVEEVRSAV